MSLGITMPLRSPPPLSDNRGEVTAAISAPAPSPQQFLIGLSARTLLRCTFRFRNGSGTSDLGFTRHVCCYPERRHLLAPQYLTKRASSGLSDYCWGLNELGFENADWHNGSFRADQLETGIGK